MAGGGPQVQIVETVEDLKGGEEEEEDEFRKSVSAKHGKRNPHKLHNNSRQANIIFWLVIGLFLIVPIVVTLCFGVHMMLEKIVLQNH